MHNMLIKIYNKYLAGNMPENVDSYNKLNQFTTYTCSRYEHFLLLTQEALPSKSPLVISIPLLYMKRMQRVTACKLSHHDTTCISYESIMYTSIPSPTAAARPR